MIPACRPMLVRQRHPRLNDYLARFTALGGSMSGNRINSLRTLFDGLWTDGLITGNLAVTSSDILQYFNPFAPSSVSSTIAQVLEPPCRPTGVTGTNNGFVSGDYTTAGMISSGSKGYDPGFKPSDVMATDSAHISIYITSFVSGTNYRILGIDGTNQADIYWSGNNDFGVSLHRQSLAEKYQGSLSYSAGSKYMLIGNRLSGTLTAFVNGTGYTGTTSDTTAPISTQNLVFGTNDNYNSPVTDRYGWESCGYGMTSTQMTNLQSRVTTFNTAIGR